jgi:hypothetical protein
MNNWMHYVKKESMKHSNNAGNSVQGKKNGHKNHNTGNQSPILEVGMQ